MPVSHLLHFCWIVERLVAIEIPISFESLRTFVTLEAGDFRVHALMVQQVHVSEESLGAERAFVISLILVFVLDVELHAVLGSEGFTTASAEELFVRHVESQNVFF